MIDESTIQKVKEAANIVDVIGDFYELRKSGIVYECLCPFHEDRHLGSFKISPVKNFAKCFSCGWSGGPIDFLMEHEHYSYPDALRWLGKKYGIDVEGSDTFKAKPSLPRPQLPPLPMLELPMWMVEAKEVSLDNPLIHWLFTGIKWDSCQSHRLYDVLQAYHVGESRDGRVIWWQIDEQQRVRTGKLMRYKSDGHRDKESDPTWIHSALYQSMNPRYSANKTEARTCLFGMHLLDHYRMGMQQQEVCIVESEKTAIIMATAYGNTPSQVWMACGGKNNINRQKLQPIIDQGRPIRLYPDRDGVKEWELQAQRLQYNNVVVDSTPVLNWWKAGDGDKADIADIVVRITNEGKVKAKPIEQIIMEDPRLKHLVRELKLKPATNKTT